MIETAFTRLVGCRVPIQLAAMPDVVTAELVRAVADAGALAMVPTPMVSAADLEASLMALRQESQGVIGANFLMPFLDVDCVAVAARHARVVEFFYGDPDAGLVARAAAEGALVSWQVGSVEEALAAERAGCDFIIAQGDEAGGHVRGRESILRLLPRVLEAVRVPVLAAGGIGSGRDLAAMLALGAAGVRLGTRFIAAAESGAHPQYVKAVIEASADDTCITDAFSGLWPDAPHRVLRSAVAAAEQCDQDPVGFTVHGGQSLPIPRFSVFVPSKHTTGAIEAMALYAGESVADVARVEPAADIIAELMRGAERILEATRQ